MSLYLYYDGDCPFCARYTRFVRLRAAAGDAHLINVREDASARERLRDLGFDLDQGMVVELDGRHYSGSEALQLLAALSSSSTAFNRLNRLLFSNRRLARLVYPLLRGGRNIALLLLGRERLYAESAGVMAPLVLFNAAFGLFVLLHSVAYCFFRAYVAEIYPSTVLMGVLGAALMMRPSQLRLFAVLLAVLIIDAWLQMPLASNHTVIKNYMLLAMLAAGVWQWLKGGRWSEVYDDFAPAGRVLLLVMYVFGIFHKINHDFLNPEVSCAVVLWREMPWPLYLVDNTAMHRLAIYGTYAAEGLILVFLLARRTRHLGIALGIAFHGLLALSGYALYVPFSMLSVVLHLLFVEREQAARILQSPFWQRLMERLRSLQGMVGLLIWVGLIAVLAWNGSYSQVAIAWMPAALVLAWACLAHGGKQEAAVPLKNVLWSRNLAVNLVSVLFFINCAAPYLGLKTAQSINMFANLHLEDGRSNHLIFHNPPGPFRYLDDVASITDHGGSKLLIYAQHNNLKLTRYHLFDHLERNPQVTASFEINGQHYQRQNAVSLGDELGSLLHPRWFRNWFHFNLVDPAQPKPCALDR